MVLSDSQVAIVYGISMLLAYCAYWLLKFAAGSVKFLGIPSPRVTYHLLKAQWEEDNRLKNFEESQMQQRLEELRSAVFSADASQSESS